MPVRRESVQTRSEHLKPRGLALPSAAVPVPLYKTGTGVKKKGVSPQQNIEGLNGETARRDLASALAAEVFMNNAG